MEAWTDFGIDFDMGLEVLGLDQEGCPFSYLA